VVRRRRKDRGVTLDSPGMIAARAAAVGGDAAAQTGVCTPLLAADIPRSMPRHRGPLPSPAGAGGTGGTTSALALGRRVFSAADVVGGDALLNFRSLCRVSACLIMCGVAQNVLTLRARALRDKRYLRAVSRPSDFHSALKTLRVTLLL
jgi:hypothetical protein